MIDKRLLTDMVAIEKPNGKDEWGKLVYDQALTLAPVLFEREYAYVGSGNNRGEKKVSVLFVFPRFCPVVFDDSFLDGKVTCDGRTFVIRKIIPQYQPFTKKILCYEVECV